MPELSPSPERPAYTGRFAPSPTGELHQGSLLTAVVSYLDARQHQGQWLVRMEDLDPPREQPGAATAIIKSLEAHGLHWDGEILYQSQRLNAYAEVLEQFREESLTYRCNCNRQRIQSLGGIYDGHCRTANIHTPPFATRLQVADKAITFTDLFQGHQQQNLAREVGDFVIHRKDGLFAYQLAVSIDDIHQGISHVIRGCDLLSSTPRQLWVFELLKSAPPQYGHLPVIVNREGQKLSKQTFAKPLENHLAAENLWQSLHYLGLNPPAELRHSNCHDILRWGEQHWCRSAIPAGTSIAEQAAQ